MYYVHEMNFNIIIDKIDGSQNRINVINIEIINEIIF